MARKVTPVKKRGSSEAEQAQTRMKMFYERRHPMYDELLPHWEFLESCYSGGRNWFAPNIFRYFKEGDGEYTDRLSRAYRFNHTREVVELVQKYLFKATITRAVDAPQELQNFWKRATRAGGSISQLMGRASTASSISGRCAIVVDNNIPAEVEVSGEKRALNQAELASGKYRVYAYVVPARHILDYAFDEDGDGELLWIKLREVVRDDADPHGSSGLTVNRVRLWTRTDWELYEEVEQTGTSAGRDKGSITIKLEDSGAHNLGFVPVRLLDHIPGEDPYNPPGLIDEIAYLDRAVANYLSSLDAIIQDQTFSQLAIPAASIMPGDDAHKTVLSMGTKRVFTYDGGAGSSASPHFLAPDPKQAGVILSVINKIINEIYHTVGLAGERTKEDNSVGIDNSSGVAKAYDFERVNSLLLSKAQACQSVENWIGRTVLAWWRKTDETDYVRYPTTFDVMRLVDDLVTAEALAKLQAPAEVRRAQMKQMIEKLLPHLTAEEIKTIEADIEKWLENPEVEMPPSLLNPGSKPVSAQSRQGEVTAATKK